MRAYRTPEGALRWGLFHAGLASLVQVVPQSAVEASSLKIDANHYHREASNRIDYSESSSACLVLSTDHDLKRRRKV